MHLPLEPWHFVAPIFLWIWPAVPLTRGLQHVLELDDFQGDQFLHLWMSCHLKLVPGRYHLHTLDKRFLERCYGFALVKQLDFLPNFHCCTSARDTWYLKFLDNSYSCNRADGASIQLPRQFYMKFVRNTWRRDPLSLIKIREIFTWKAYSSWNLHSQTRPDAAHCATTTKRRPRKNMTPPFKTRENPATSALHCFSFEGFHMFILDTFQLATNEDSKGFASKNGYLQPKINLSSIISLPFPRKDPTQNVLTNNS